MILRQGIFVNHLLPILFLSQLKEGFIEMGVSPLAETKKSHRSKVVSLPNRKCFGVQDFFILKSVLYSFFCRIYGMPRCPSSSRTTFC